jgi:hypothetical protein
MLLGLPIGLLAALAVAGWGLASLVGVRLPADARAALAAPAGAALFACASPLLLVGAPVAWLALTCIALGGLSALLVREESIRVLKAGGVPALVACVSLVALSAPWAMQRSWEPATYGNADPYLWVSQARAYLDDPAPSPGSEFVDRQAYESVTERSWPTALPFGVASVAAASQTDPVESYSAFAVLLGALLTLVAYVIARGLLVWTPRRAAVGALVSGLGAYLSFATWYGWQAQVGLTAFALVSLALFRLALERDGRTLEAIGSGLFAASAIATYGSLFGAFLPAFVAVTAGYVVVSRRLEPRPLLRVVLVSSAAAIVAGLVPAARALRSLGTLGNSLAVDDWNRYAHGQVGEAMGLIPRSVDLGRPTFGWSVAAAVVACAVAAVLWNVIRRGRAQALGLRFDFLLGTSAYFVVLLLILRLPTFSPYVSMKIAGYGAVSLTITTFAALTVPRPGHWAASRLAGYTRLAAIVLFVAATAVTYLSSFTHLRGSHSYEAVRNTVGTDGGGWIAVDIKDAWRQSWIVYYLRDHRVALREPSDYITGAGSHGAKARAAPVVIKRGRTRTDTWDDGTLDILVCAHPANSCTTAPQ